MPRTGIPFGLWLAAPCRRDAWASDNAIPAHRRTINSRVCRTILFMALSLREYAERPEEVIEKP